MNWRAVPSQVNCGLGRTGWLHPENGEVQPRDNARAVEVANQMAGQPPMFDWNRARADHPFGMCIMSPQRHVDRVGGESLSPVMGLHYRIQSRMYGVQSFRRASGICIMCDVCSESDSLAASAWHAVRSEPARSLRTLSQRLQGSYSSRQPKRNYGTSHLAQRSAIGFDKHT